MTNNDTKRQKKLKYQKQKFLTTLFGPRDRKWVIIATTNILRSACHTELKF